MENMLWDQVVVGLGGVGSFALRAVARDNNNNNKVLGLERFVRGHDRGSSHGQSRVYRRAYVEHSNYVPWIEFSLQEFRKLEQSQGVGIVEETGVLLLVPKNQRELLDRAVASAKEHNIPIEEELLQGPELQNRFPQFNYHQNDEMVGLYEPGGGFLRPEIAIQSALQDAQAQGATIWEETVVDAIREVAADTATMGKPPYVELTVRRQGGTAEQIHAKTVLVAAGPWTAELIPEYQPHLKVLRQLQTWVDITKTADPTLYDSSRMPCLGMVCPDRSRPIYALVADNNNNNNNNNKYSTCIKLGIHARDDPVDPNKHSPEIITEAEQTEMAAAYQSGFHPDVASQPLTETKACMYTMTQDEHFVIGVPRGYYNVCAVAGLSGHGFKMLPALGQMLADFASGKGLESWNADFCSPSRFGV